MRKSFKYFIFITFLFIFVFIPSVSAKEKYDFFSFFQVLGRGDMPDSSIFDKPIDTSNLSELNEYRREYTNKLKEIEKMCNGIDIKSSEFTKCKKEKDKKIVALDKEYSEGITAFAPNKKKAYTGEGESLCNVLKKKGKAFGKNESLIDIFKEILIIFQFAGVALFVIMNMADFTKSIASQNDDALKKSEKHLFKRIVALIALLLTSSIIQLAFNIAEIDVINSLDPFCLNEATVGGSE